MTPPRATANAFAFCRSALTFGLCTAIASFTACGDPPHKGLDPTKDEVRLGSCAGYDASLIHQSDVGVWTVACLNIFDRYGSPEIVTLDDLGRCTIFKSYSGKWTPTIALQDGLWLGAIAFADIDPHRPGNELYVAGKRGNVYQIVSHPQGGFDVTTVAYLPGREIHTLVAAEMLPEHPGIDLLAFTSPGGLYRIEPPKGIAAPSGGTHIQELPGRVRDACVLTTAADARPAIATADDTGEVRLLWFEDGMPVWRTIYKTSMGLSRLAMRERPGLPQVLYVSADDGRVIRLQERPDNSFDAEVIHVGPKGPRGLAVGRFTDDPDEESLAIYGYSARVDLLIHSKGRWSIENIFQDIDKGHWLAAGELCGRNATDEIVISGFAGRVVLLSKSQTSTAR